MQIDTPETISTSLCGW